MTECIHTNLTPLHARAYEGEREREEDLLCIQGVYCVKLHYIEISVDQQPSTSHVGHQTSSSSSAPERQPSTSREEPQPSTSRSDPQPSTSDQSLPGSDYTLHELGRVELDSDADLKGVLVGSLYYVI